MTRAEIDAAKAERPRHRRLRFNTQLVCKHLGLGLVPARIVDVAGVCKILKIEREALEALIKKGLPHADINPRESGR